MNSNNYSNKVLIKMQEEVKKVIQNSGTQAAAAVELNVTPGQIIHLRDGDWPNVGEATFQKVKSKLKLTEWGNYPTQNFGMAVTVAQSAKDDARMVGLIGYTGAGKTHALTKYSSSKSDVYYVLADTEQTKFSFLKEIAKATGVRLHNEYSKMDMINAIVRQMTTGRTPLLIIDDTGKLSDANLRLIQIIYDRTEFRCGILLAGMPYLKTSIDRKAGKDIKGFQELRRRVAYWEEMKPMTKRDIELVCEDNEITDEGAMKYLTRECQDFGTLRNMVNNALKLSNKTGEGITAELLTKMNKGRRN